MINSDSYSTPAEEAHELTSEEGSVIDDLIIKAVSGALIANLQLRKDDSNSWKTKVIALFDEVWDELEEEQIWQRLSILVAYNARHLSEKDIDEILNEDMMSVAEQLKDSVIDKVIAADNDKCDGKTCHDESSNVEDADDTEDDEETDESVADQSDKNSD